MGAGSSMKPKWPSHLSIWVAPHDSQLPTCRGSPSEGLSWSWLQCEIGKGLPNASTGCALSCCRQMHISIHQKRSISQRERKLIHGDKEKRWEPLTISSLLATLSLTRRMDPCGMCTPAAAAAADGSSSAISVQETERDELCRSPMNKQHEYMMMQACRFGLCCEHGLAKSKVRSAQHSTAPGIKNCKDAAINANDYEKKCRDRTNRKNKCY